MGKETVDLEQLAKNGAKLAERDTNNYIAELEAALEEAGVPIPNDLQILKADVPATIIPNGMDAKQAAIGLLKRHQQEEAVVDTDRVFTGWEVNDVLVAIQKASKSIFGWVNAQATRSFFGTSYPIEREIPIGYNEKGEMQYMNCFYGKMGIESWDGALMNTSITRDEDGTPAVVITVNSKRKWQSSIKMLFDKIESTLKNESIYKGKFITYKNGNFKFIFPKYQEGIELEPGLQTLIDVKIISCLGEESQNVLFSGVYGTGKTETARNIGIRAVEKGVTFIYCEEPQEFAKLLKICQNYLPALLFVEDVESITNKVERDSEVNDIFNTLDGISTKNKNISTIFTTNNKERVHPAMRRPGRIDILAEFKLADNDIIKRIYKNFFSGLKNEDKLDYEKLADATPNVQAAVIARIAASTKTWVNKKNEGVITDELVLMEITQMRDQIEYMQEAQEVTSTPASRLHSSMKELVDESIKDSIAAEEVNNIAREMGVMKED